ncbi:MAG TPA: thioesterase family protein [Symbiobacteriaceae bacterium]|jgi:acyl-CoA thioester hydrolase
MEGYHFTVDERVIWRDLDSLGHVNNAVYATYFETGRIEYFGQVIGDYQEISSLILAEITVTYKSPAYLGETLVIGVRISEVRNSSFIMESQITDQKTGRLVATSRAVLVCFDYTAQRSVPVPAAWRDVVGRFEGRDFSAGEA